MLTTDDELAYIDNVYLGPPGWTFPWRARYVAYGVGGGIAFTGYVFGKWLGIPPNLWTIAWLLLLTVWVTTGFLRHVNFEMPFRAVVATFVHEVSGPRPPAAVRGVAVPGRVVIRHPAAPKPAAPRPAPAVEVEVEVDEPPMGSPPRIVSGVCVAWMCDACRSNQCTHDCHEGAPT